MALADLCIKRPVFATIINLFLVVLGWFSFQSIGVDQFPNVELPIVTVTTTLRGASPEEMDTSVTKLFVVEDGVAHSRPVEVGLVKDRRQEVLSGLKAGELVVTSGQTKLHEGSKVRIKSEEHKDSRPAGVTEAGQPPQS